MNSLKEYGLRTPTPPKTSYKHFGEDNDDEDDTTAVAAGARSSQNPPLGDAAAGVASTGAAGGGSASTNPEPQHSSVSGEDASAGASAAAAAAAAAERGSLSAARGGGTVNAEGGLVQGVGGLNLGAGPEEVEGEEDASSDHRAAEAAARARAMSRRRKEAEASSLAAVGACLVTSSVRKDGKVCLLSHCCRWVLVCAFVLLCVCRVMRCGWVGGGGSVTVAVAVSCWLLWAVPTCLFDVLDKRGVVHQTTYPRATVFFPPFCARERHGSRS